MDLFKTRQFCNPVAVTQQIGNQMVTFPIIDPAARLACYKVRRPITAIRYQVISTDQFGEQDLTVQKRRTELCVPSQEIAGPAPATPLEHFELYRAKTTPGTEKFEKQEVILTDQFLTNETVKLRRPVRFSVPTDKDEEGIVNSLTHMTCYSVQAPRFQKRDVEVVNQFSENGDTFRLTVRRPNLLCVPSYKECLFCG